MPRPNKTSLRVLLAWELGGGIGHITRLASLAHRLLNLGATTLVALRPGADARRAFAVAQRHDPRFRLIPAPVVDPGCGRSPGIADRETLADAMIGFGYDRSELIFASADLWNSILLRAHPDLVISDCAPSLNLTAAGRFRSSASVHHLSYLRVVVRSRTCVSMSDM